MVTNLVLGAEGFVGKPLCKFLEEKRGEKVVSLDIKSNPDSDCRHAILNLDNIDRVYFLAWDVGGAKYLYREDTQLQQLDWNLKLMLNVIPQIQAKGIPFLFISSQLAEECDSVYGVTKRLGEVWAKLLNSVRVRLWNVYGPLERSSERSHVISDFVFQALETGEIRMLTTGDEKRQFIYIDDVCAAFHKALSERLESVYDVASFEWIRVLDVANMIAKHTGAKVIPGTQYGVTPITRMRGKIPGWLPQVSLDEGIQRMVKEGRKLFEPCINLFGKCTPPCTGKL